MSNKKYERIKALLFVGTALWASISFGSQAKPIVPDSSLGRLILSKVLSKNREGNDLVVFTDVSEAEIRSLQKNRSALLWTHIMKVYGVSDDAGVARILSQRYPGRFLRNGKPKQITLVTTTGEAKQREVLRALKKTRHPVIVDFLIVLYNRSSNQCLAYYHIINEGFCLATLERKNKSWKITEFTVETLE